MTHSIHKNELIEKVDILNDTVASVLQSVIFVLKDDSGLLSVELLDIETSRRIKEIPIQEVILVVNSIQLLQKITQTH